MSDGPDAQARFRGCLLGGAIGDALGAPIEFLSMREIRSRYGPLGVRGYVDGRGFVTDDTQMTLFTAEGLIRASVCRRVRGVDRASEIVHRAYLRWLDTQREPLSEGSTRTDGGEPGGWLVAEPRLHRRRAPGGTCVSALASGRAGSPRAPLNESKGCGGVMRAASAGLMADDPEAAFELGCRIAAITHGHPSGWLPAGVLAAMVALLIGGADLPEAAETARRLLDAAPGRHETAAAMDRALRLASAGPPEPEDLEQLGGGWVGEEALAMAHWCALSCDNVTDALLAAVNHSGDSDSTGAICGNLVGAARGVGALPAGWNDPLDLGDIVATVADDLWRERFDPPGSEIGESRRRDWFDRYPGW